MLALSRKASISVKSVSRTPIIHTCSWVSRTVTCSVSRGNWSERLSAQRLFRLRGRSILRISWPEVSLDKIKRSRLCRCLMLLNSMIPRNRMSTRREPLWWMKPQRLLYEREHSLPTRRLSVGGKWRTCSSSHGDQTWLSELLNTRI